MTSEGGHNVGIGDIQPLASAPANEPDQLTRKALEKDRRRAKGPTLSERFDASNARHLEDVSKKRDEYARRCHELQIELKRVESERASGRELLYGTALHNVLSTILMGAGGVAVSSATYHASLQTWLLYGGYAVFGCAAIYLFVVTVYVLIRSVKL